MENLITFSSVVTAFATVCYTLLTFLMINQMKKSNRLLDEPLVYVYVQDKNWTEFYLKIENIGRGVAYNISFDFDQDFEYIWHEIPISEMPLFKFTKNLKPRETNETMLECEGFFENPKMPKNFNITVNYEDRYGNKFTNIWFITSEMYKKRLHVNTK